MVRRSPRSAAVPAASAILPLVLAATMGGCAPPALAVYKSALASGLEAEGWYQLSLIRLPEEVRWPVELLGSTPCSALEERLRVGGDLIVLLLGDSPPHPHEWRSVLGALARLPVRGVFKFRWDASAATETQAKEAAVAVSRLLQCAGTDGTRVLVLGHGGGGLVGALAGAFVSVPASIPRAQVHVVAIQAIPVKAKPSDVWARFRAWPEPIPPPALGVKVLVVEQDRAGGPDALLSVLPFASSPALVRVQVPATQPLMEQVAHHLGRGELDLFARAHRRTP